MILEEIYSSCPPAASVQPEHLSQQCWSFLQRLLTPDVSSRSSVAEALAHPWLAYLPWQQEQHAAAAPQSSEQQEPSAPLDVDRTDFGPSPEDLAGDDSFLL